MFNLAIDSKLRGCDLVNLNVRDITHGSKVLTRAMVVQRVDRTFIGEKRAQAASLPK